MSNSLEATLKDMFHGVGWVIGSARTDGWNKGYSKTLSEASNSIIGHMSRSNITLTEGLDSVDDCVLAFLTEPAKHLPEMAAQINAAALKDAAAIVQGLLESITEKKHGSDSHYFVFVKHTNSFLSERIIAAVHCLDGARRVNIEVAFGMNEGADYLEEHFDRKAPKPSIQ